MLLQYVITDRIVELTDKIVTQFMTSDSSYSEYARFEASFFHIEILDLKFSLAKTRFMSSGTGMGPDSGRHLLPLILISSMLYDKI